MGGATLPGPLNGHHLGNGWIDDGTMCRARTPSPGSTGAHSPVTGTYPTTPRAFLFVLADEVLPSGKVIRKVMVAPDHVTSAAFVRNPEVFGFSPRAPGAAVSIGEHALGNNASPYVSASTKRGGAPNFAGEPFHIDIAKAQAAGVRLYTTDEIIADLRRLATQRPELRFRVDKLISIIKSVEGEVLLEGHVPATAVKSATSMNVTRGLRVVQFIGIVVTVYDVAKATRQSIETRSAVPIAREGIRQVGGWGGAVVGMKIGGTVGAAVGIETGPGAIITGAVGALIFGAAGYLGADWVANWAVE
jgi:hypothetical protein